MNPLFGLQDQQTTMVFISVIQNTKLASENYQNDLYFQKQRCVGGRCSIMAVYLFLWVVNKLQIILVLRLGQQGGPGAGFKMLSRPGHRIESRIVCWRVCPYTLKASLVFWALWKQVSMGQNCWPWNMSQDLSSGSQAVCSEIFPLSCFLQRFKTGLVVP